MITATVRPDGRQAIVPVISDPEVERDGKLVETRTDVKAGKFELGRSLVITEGQTLIGSRKF